MRRVTLALASVALIVPLPLAAQDDATKPQDEKKAFKRRDTSTDEDLRKQLLAVPEVGLDQAGASLLLNQLSKFGKTGTPAPDIGMRFYATLAQRLKKPELMALPWQNPIDAQLGKETAERLHVFSTNLRNCMRQSVPANDVRPDPEKLKTLLTGHAPSGLPGLKGKARIVPGGAKPLEWSKTECVPAIAQMMQTEGAPLRLLMIDMLTTIEGKAASVVLAQRAVFDLSPDVREKAVESLGKRPAKEYQQVLLDGLRWPWQPAADHAAEALAVLKIKDALPELVAMLNDFDPTQPFAKEGKDKGVYVREVVRLNHLSNCLLCHAPSHSREDLVRGRVPTPGSEMPPAYYGASNGDFVRADTTFLRQDFSVMQPAAVPGKWPGQQRFDYLMRTRKATAKELKMFNTIPKDRKLAAMAYPQREAVLFALREMTGTDRGSQTEGWLKLLEAVETK